MDGILRVYVLVEIGEIDMEGERREIFGRGLCLYLTLEACGKLEYERMGSKNR
jgi:hypothetical protein